MTYYLFDHLLKDDKLVLIFQKDFDYMHSGPLDEAILRLTLNKPITTDKENPIYFGADNGYTIDYTKNESSEILILTDNAQNRIEIKCDSIDKETFHNTKEELLSTIQFLETQLDNRDKQIHEKSKLNNNIISFCKRELDSLQKIIDSADWLNDQRKTEIKAKQIILNQILTLTEN